MATLIQIELVGGKAISKRAFQRDWDTYIKYMQEPLSKSMINNGAFHTFSLNKKGDRAVSKVEWPDECGIMEILKK